jgi:hypothetical protein
LAAPPFFAVLPAAVERKTSECEGTSACPKIGLPTFSFNAGADARVVAAPRAALDKRGERIRFAIIGAILR